MSTEQNQNGNPDDVADASSENTPGAESAAQEVESGSPVDGEQLQDEVTRLREDLLRAHAEMQNLRRRAERDVENAHKYALDKFVADIVSVADNLERATAAIDPEVEAVAAIGEGVTLTYKGFLDVLRRFNVEQVDPQGQPFDPERHQAMTTVPHKELPPNTVLEVFQKGYVLNGRLVRPAMVVVTSAG